MPRENASASEMLRWTGAYAKRWTELMEVLDPVALVDHSYARYLVRRSDDPVTVAEEDHRNGYVAKRSN